jgi:hypothetical protein
MLLGKSARSSVRGKRREAGGAGVCLWAQPADPPTLARLRALIQADVRAGVPAAKAYGWLGGRAGVYNCATWPRSLGAAVPEETGQLADDIAALRRVSGGRQWTP